MHTKSDLTCSFQQKLQQLTQFNSALIYGFEPEASPNHTLGSTKWEDNLYPGMAQHEDLLDGYLFAQNNMLPALCDLENNPLKEAELINHIKQLHHYIGNTLLNVFGGKAGKFVDTRISRWNPDVEASYLVQFILFKMKHPTSNEDPKTLLIKLLTKELPLNEEQVNQFVAIMERIKNDSTIKLKGSLTKSANYELMLYEKVAQVIKTDKLTQAEKDLVNQIVMIGRDPLNIPTDMDNFAKDTLTKWKNCDKKDWVAVSEFLADLFYQFTDIHPFGNANGRTATCLVNVFLRSINLPSILMRNPGDRDNSASSYSYAIAMINKTREPLAKHIFQRIKEAQLHPFSDKTQEETVILRCKVVSQLQLMQSQNPNLDINNYQAKLHGYFIDEQYLFEMMQQGCVSVEDVVIFGLKKFIVFLADEAIRLEQVKQPKLINPGFFVTTSLNNTQKEQLKQDLTSLTQTEGWKINPKNNLECWIEIPEKTKAEEVANTLKKAGIGNVTLTKRTDNQMPVVKCSKINVETLHTQSNIKAECDLSRNREGLTF